MNPKEVSFIIIAGLCAGAWPLVMRPAGLSGSGISLMYAAFCLVAAIVLFCTVGQFKISDAAAGIAWPYAIGGSVLAAAALVFMSLGVAAAPSDQAIRRLYLILLMVQISVPAIVQLFSGTATPKQYAGIVLAALAAFLLG